MMEWLDKHDEKVRGFVLDDLRDIAKAFNTNDLEEVIKEYEHIRSLDDES